MELLNLHLTGDMHAVTAAHNLLSAMIDNHLYQGNKLGIDIDNITWRRVLDVNDRALRNIVIGLGPRGDGVTRQTGFDITAASELMATLALTTSLSDLRQRLSRIVVGYTSDGTPVTAEELHGGRVDGRDPARRDQAEPAADHGEHAGARAHRAVRQHRHRQLLDRGRPDRDPHRGLPGHRGRVRRGHGSRAVLQHQVPQLRAGAGRRGRGRDGAGAQGALGQVQGRRGPPAAARRCSRRTPTTCWQARRTCASKSRTSGCTASLRWSRSARSRPTTPASTRRSVRSPRRWAPGPRYPRHFDNGGRGATELAEAVVEAADEPSDFQVLYPDQASLREKIETVATKVYGAAGGELLVAGRQATRHL